MNEAEREANRRLNMRAALADPSPIRWWWLSFVDTDLPAGSQFLGAVMVEAPNFLLAVQEALLRGINPGGEVQGQDLPDWAVPRLDHQNVLLDRAGCAAADAHFLTLRPASWGQPTANEK
jgi:hypothetical protein